MMAVSRNHTCGLSLSNRVWCWGYAGDGETGTGAPPAAPTDFLLIPVEVGGNPSLRFQTLVAGGQHACAITTEAQGSSAYCWGFNASGQLGDGTTATQFVPTLVTGGNTFMSAQAPIAGQLVSPTIAAGYDHTCALTVGGAAVCWGGNASGQLGNGGGAGSSAPVAVGGGQTFVAITAGEAHSCGLTAGGAIYCWGSNASGQLGTGNTTGSSTPTLVSGGLSFSSVSAGDQHTCGVTTGNVAYCWGDNQYGQLGDGTTVRRLVPTRVAFQP